MVAFEGSLNCTFRVAESPGARLFSPVTVMYGLPEKLPLAFKRVTPLVSPDNTISNGPAIVLALVF
jgi:hypothetical protein